MADGHFVHPMADVQGAEIGAGTRVWQFASVVRGAKLGIDCSVASGATIDAARLGDRCIVGHNALVSPGAWIGDDVFIGPGAVLCNDTWPSTSKIGFDIGALLDGSFVTIRVEDGAAISAGAVILPGVTVGAGAIVAAGAVVAHSVPARTVFFREGAMRAITDVHVKTRMRPA